MQKVLKLILMIALVIVIGVIVFFFDSIVNTIKGQLNNSDKPVVVDVAAGIKEKKEKILKEVYISDFMSKNGLNKKDMEKGF